MSSPDPERVREALAVWNFSEEPLGNAEIEELAEAARSWLAGSSPDYEAAAEAWFNIEAGIEDLEFGEELRWSEIDQIVREDYLRKARAAVDAAFPNREGGSPQ